MTVSALHGARTVTKPFLGLLASLTGVAAAGRIPPDPPAPARRRRRPRIRRAGPPFFEPRDREAA